jgi:hypothetical protein
MKERTLTLNCTSGEEVTKKQHACFVHNLIADISKPKPLIQWRRSNSKDGIVYCSNGLAEGTLMTLRMLTNKPGAEITYSRHGKLIYTATETDGDVNCDMHLAHLLHKVNCAVTMAEATKKPDLLAQVRETIDEKCQKPQKELTGPRVGDLFRKVTADQIIDHILRKPSMLSINVTENSPEFARLETLIRAVVGYIQAVRPINSRYLLKGFALRSVTGNSRVCNHIMLAPMSDIAGAFAELDDKVYGGLKPAEQTEKFVADVVVNMLIGI